MVLLTVEETTKMLKVSPMTVRRYIAAGLLPALRVGKGIRVREESLDELLQPVEPKTAKRVKDRPVKREKRTPAAQALLNLAELGRLAPPSEGPTDVSENKHRYLAEAYESRINR